VINRRFIAEVTVEDILTNINFTKNTSAIVLDFSGVYMILQFKKFKKSPWQLLKISVKAYK